MRSKTRIIVDSKLKILVVVNIDSHFVLVLFYFFITECQEFIITHIKKIYIYILFLENNAFHTKLQTIPLTKLDQILLVLTMPFYGIFKYMGI